MKHSPQQNEVKYFCEQCQDFTPFKELEVTAYCPDCQQLLNVTASCGCQSFFCQNCKAAKSSKKVLWKPT